MVVDASILARPGNSSQPACTIRVPAPDTWHFLEIKEILWYRQFNLGLLVD